MDELHNVKELILAMVKAIVSNPDEVEIHVEDRTEGGNEITQINVKVAKPDIRIAIGKGGNTAEAVRTIAWLAATNAGHDKPISFRIDAPRIPSNHFYNK
tara:strand:- start:605 stop:904 length:300 start_codon:yes stop_codon:yes gene_type:complete